MRTIDLEHWDRAGHYLFFRRMACPQYILTCELDITNFYNSLKNHGLQFYFGIIHAAVKAMNEFDAFKYRIRDDSVILHDCIHPSFSYLAPGEENFKMVTADFCDDLREFVRITSEKTRLQREHFILSEVEGRDDLIYITCIPWVSFLHLSHTVSFNPDDAVPRLAWGKYHWAGNKLLLPFSVQAHHSFVDGFHMSQYINRLQEELDGGFSPPAS